MPGFALRQLALRRRLDERLRQMRSHARGAAAARQAQVEAEQRRNRLTAEHAALASPSPAELVFRAVMLAALPTVYLIDVILLGPVAEFLASAGFPENSLVVRAAPFVVPVMIIGLEMVVGAFRLAAHRKYLAGDRGPWLFRTLTVAAACLALFLPMAGLALYWDAQTTMPATRIAQAVMVLPMMLAIVLSLTCHLCILLGAGEIHEAKAWLVFEMLRRYLQSQAESRRQTFVRKSTAAADLLVPYLRDLDEYNASYQPPLTAGPFDDQTRAIINGVYGYEVLRAAPTAPRPAPERRAEVGAEPAPAPTDPAATAPDGPDWQALAARQRYNDEAEVRA
jgi:hypothetical protein